MRKNLIATLGIAALAAAVLTQTSLALPLTMKSKELESFCDKKGGFYSTDFGGNGVCQIGTGKSAVQILCGANGKCTINKSGPNLKSAKNSAVGNIVSTLGNAGRAWSAGKASAASSATATRVGAGTAAGGTAVAKTAPANSGSNVGLAGHVGVGLPPSGRLSLRPQ